MAVTTIPTAGIADNTVTVAKTSGVGITMADQWRLSADLSTSGSTTTLTSNLEQNDTLFSNIGTAMTESSGVFTFPSTGIYLVQFRCEAKVDNAASRTVDSFIAATTDGFSSNTTYIAQASSNMFDSDSVTTTTMFCQALYDVTNTSNNKVKFQYVRFNSGDTIKGSSSANETTMTFTRLGDT